MNPFSIIRTDERRGPIRIRRGRSPRRGPRSRGFDVLEGRVLLAPILSDFDGDGTDDLAVGVPGEAIGDLAGAGAINVIYGKKDVGLTAEKNQLWWQGNNGIAGTPEAGDQFGAALAAGDFNGDGYADLAIGAPGEDEAFIASRYYDAGVVHVLYGSKGNGLTAAGSQIWWQGVTDFTGIAIEGTRESGNRFGAALTTGDFNGDGYDDLAVGAPGEDIGTLFGAGAVNVIFGSPGGLNALLNKVWNQGLTDTRTGLTVADVAEPGDLFGAALAAGDFNHDSITDLAIAAPGEDLSSTSGKIVDAGLVHVLYGRLIFGPTAANNQVWHQYIPYKAPYAKGHARVDDRFGSALAVGNFDGDNYDDLAIGVPGEDVYWQVGNRADAGAVNVLYGSAAGLSAVGNQLWYQGLNFPETVPESGDRYGASLAAGNFDGDNYDDLTIGVPGEGQDVDGKSLVNAGQVDTIYGSAGRLDPARRNFGVGEVPATDDFMGATVAAGDFDGDAADDLAVGMPVATFTVGGVRNRSIGAVGVAYGEWLVGLTESGAQFWYQDSPGIQGFAEAGDRFGGALSGLSIGTFTSRDLYVNFDGVNITRAKLEYWSSDWDHSLDQLDEDGNGIVVQPFEPTRNNREAFLKDILTKLQEDLIPFGITVQRHRGLAVQGIGATTIFVGPNTVTDKMNVGLGVFDFGNDNRTDIGFVRTPGFPPGDLAQWAADVILHEAGHTWGLYHVASPSTQEVMGMGYSGTLPGTNGAFLDRTFPEFYGPDGEPAGEGRGPQNSYRTMMDLFVTGAGVASGLGGLAGLPLSRMASPLHDEPDSDPVASRQDSRRQARPDHARPSSGARPGQVMPPAPDFLPPDYVGSPRADVRPSARVQSIESGPHDGDDDSRGLMSVMGLVHDQAVDQVVAGRQLRIQPAQPPRGRPPIVDRDALEPSRDPFVIAMAPAHPDDAERMTPDGNDGDDPLRGPGRGLRRPILSLLRRGRARGLRT